MLAIEQFERGASRFPDRVLVTDGTESITYAQMRGLSQNIAQSLIRGGVAPDDAVAILSPNHSMVLACQYAILKAGAVWVPCNYRNSAADNVRQLAMFEVRWLFAHSSLIDQAELMRKELPLLKGVVCLDQAVDGMPELQKWSAPQGEPLPFPMRRASDTVAILSTSGTTGLPKGAVHANRSFEMMTACFRSELKFDEAPIHLVIAPLTHAAGVFHYTLLSQGATNVILGSTDPESIMQAIEKHRVSVLFLPPTVIYMLLAHPKLKEYDYSSLRYFIYGAAPMSVDKLREAVSAFGPVMAQCYGQAEALMMCAWLSPSEHAEILNNPAVSHRIAAAGRESPFTRIEIMLEDGSFAPSGTQGEVVFQSDYVMKGYFKDPKATEEISRFGWHHTGDIGIKDKDGFLYLVDRKRDLIISGGFNVFPTEVEQAALGFPAVQDCVVVGVPDEKWGELVIAAVEIKAGHVFDEAEFIAFCKQRLGSVKAPKRVEIWEALPRSTVGKTLRRVVREKYWVGKARQI
ncbi:MAG: putative fatty-acid-CoA ligase [Hydrocarboniphaga sp.]|uniref:class I adenylate-forming enzyme family protein n=1 Tax=Hydrocarboniphaga sp. TaxID=2033016 RepID=UPI00261CB324|nr:AMP-binding protein [Hydrocarboniphaga sp.]MDB5971161.1 putative fatty-acid-CoA ligase [Hydrocarboniphaga sp.]